MDDRTENQLVMCFTRKGVRDHARGLVSLSRPFLLAALAVFGAIWTCFEAPAYFLHANLSGGSFYLGAIAASILAAAAWTTREYLNICPPGFELESKRTQRIAHVQRTKWEHALARQLLGEVLLDLDDELAALSEGRVFVPIEKRPHLAEYMRWVNLGPTNMLRMIDVAKKLLVLDLPSVLGSPDDPAKPQKIRKVVYRIRDLYKETVAFECSRRSVAPPEGAERRHELQFGWTDPVRDGVRQMFEFFDRILSLDSLTDQTVSFTVTMDEPDNIQEFCDELSRVRDSWEPLT